MNKKLSIDRQLTKRTSFKVILCASIMILLNATLVWAIPITMSPDPAVLNMGGSLGDVELTLNNADTTSNSYEFTLTGSNRTGSGWIDFRLTNIGGGWDGTTIAVGTPLSGVSDYSESILNDSIFDFSINTSSTNWSLNLQIKNVASWDHPSLVDGNFIAVSASNLTQGIEFEPVMDFPTPDIKANSLDGPVTPTGNLSVTIELDPGSRSGNDADWWVAANVSGTSTIDGWYYFDLSAFGFVPVGDSPFNLIVTHQGPLFNLPTIEILNIPVSGLPSGTYTFYFAVDTNRNGVLDLGELFFDSVVVVITP